MDRKVIFEAFLYNRENETSTVYADIALPATYYELQDAIEKTRVRGENRYYMELTEYEGFLFLEPYLEEADDLYELNALAEKLASLEPWQVDALEGLILMEEAKKEPFGISRIYDLAASANECQVLYNVRTDAELGDFYASNGFLPELDELSDEVRGLLDYCKIGEKMRRDENGVFLRYSTGYVTVIGDLKEEFHTLELPPRKPDYTVLLEVGVPDAADVVMLGLPCERKALNDVLTQLNAGGWSVLSWRCADCRIPALRDAFSTTDNILYTNLAAKEIAELSDDAAAAFKALIEAVQPNDINTAMSLLESIDEYVFSPQYSSPDDLAADELTELMGESEAALAIPYMDLRAYGERLLEENEQVMTSYGVIERRDGQPILAAQEEQRRQMTGGLEMMGM